MELFAQLLGILAVIFFLLSYQMKIRKNIILMNAFSRILYIIQYIFLGAFEGAVLDVLGTISSLLADKKNNRFISKYIKFIFISVNLMIIIAGMYLYKNIFSIFPIIGVILHTSAFWISDEKNIRKLSLAGSPFWLIYNLSSKAYGSSIGDILSIISIITAMLRYDIKNIDNEN